MDLDLDTRNAIIKTKESLGVFLENLTVVCCVSIRRRCTTVLQNYNKIYKVFKNKEIFQAMYMLYISFRWMKMELDGIIVDFGTIIEVDILMLF